ncbi:MAG TPA: TonB-dependent receptor [Phnomibacter sp.]|nr:TonB-dependent receptor [Phnomibacter sp.]
MKFLQKEVLLAALLLVSTTQLIAQEDSGKIVQLENVTLVGKSKSTAQQLAIFYKTNGAASLEDILSRLPEMAMMRRGSYGMEPNIRSMNGGQINVLIDGMKLHGACTDKMDPATIYIEPINLENLQLQTGTQGFTKGSAIGGTLDMKMAEPTFNNTQRWNGQVSGGYQSVSQGWYNGTVLQYSSQRWAFRGSASFRSNSDYTDGNRNEVAYSGYHKTNFSLSAKFRLNNQTELKADMLTDDGWDIGYAALPMDVGSAKARLAALSVNRTNTASKWYSWQAKVYANAVRHKMDDSQRKDVPMHMDMPGISKTAGMFVETKARLTDNQNLQLRLDAATTFLSASMTMYPPNEVPMYMLTWPDNRNNQAGLSASWQWKPDSNYSLRMVARMDAVQSQLGSDEAKDYIDITGGNTAPRFDLLKNLALAGTRYLHHGWQLNASAGYAERMPTASELYGFYLFNAFDGYDYMGNTRLQPEAAMNADASIGHNGRRAKWLFTAFYTRVLQQIVGRIDSSFTPMTIGAKGVKVYEQMPYSNRYGLEASLQWKLHEALALVSTLRYTVASGSDGKPLPFIAPLKNIGSLRYTANRLWAQVEYEASLAQNKVNNAFGEKPTPGFVLAHARLGYTLPFFKERIALQAGVENIFDAAYREHLDWGTVLRPGRNLYAQFKCSF